MMNEKALAEAYGLQSYDERVIKDVKPPEGVAEDKDFYAQGVNDWVPNVSFLRRHFFREGRLSEQQILFILRKVKDCFLLEPNVLKLKGPITICGDIHGQYYDLVHFMSPEIGGNPLRTQYLFLGDYVDRGCFGVECALWLFAIKIVQPKAMYLLRGNHESRHLTDYFTFKLECKKKYSEHIYNAFIEVFKSLPLAAVVDDAYFCVHGGIGPDLRTIDDLDMIDRLREPPTRGLMCDVLWSDPAEEGPLLPDAEDFSDNRVRGCSCYYSYSAVTTFLKRNNLKSIIRGHEAQKEGYRMGRMTAEKAPSVITVFSAPNYCDAYMNKGAVLLCSGGNLTIRWFNHSPHPFWLQNFANAFVWSLPFVAEKALDMLQVFLDTVDPEGESSNTDAMDTSPTNKEPSRLVLGQLFRVLREESEGASEFRNLPVALSRSLGSAAEEGKKYIPDFDHARTSDILNERLPPALVDVREARDYMDRKGIYGFEESSTQLARKISIGTTFSSSPSTRKRSVEVTTTLIRQAAKLAGQERIGRKAILEQRVLRLWKLKESQAAQQMADAIRSTEDE